MRWPVGIALVLLTVICVQIAFAAIAITHSDTLDPTYAAERR